MAVAEVPFVIRRLALAVLCGAAVVAGGRAAHAAGPGSAPSADPTGLQSIRRGYDDLLGVFYEPLDPATLLRGGWDELTAVVPASAPQPQLLPALPAGKDAAFATFTTAYNAYAATLARTGGDPPLAALLVVDGMANSVNEQHTNLIVGSLDAALAGQSFGFGWQISPQPPFYVTELAPDGPAQRAGV